MDFVKEFENPASAYRIKPFWFLNGDITREEISRQLCEMAEKGIGGVFICARQGMTVPYLSAEWFQLVEYACDEARRYGLEPWLYDEYPYPSGMGGGEVLLEHPEAEHMVLKHHCFYRDGGEVLEEDFGWGRILFAKAFLQVNQSETDWETFVDLKPLIGTIQAEKIFQKSGLTAYNEKRFFSYGPRQRLKTILPKGSWRLEIYCEEALGDFKYYGGFFDPCNQAAVKTFIRGTHEKYKKQMGAGFEKGIKGMFSDETGLLSPIPWSRLLPAEFEKQNGYSLLAVLPALHDCQFRNALQIRYDLYNTIHQLFRRSYHQQIGNWCRNNGLLYATEVPSMRHSTQRYSDIIGGDTGHEKLGKSLEWMYDTYLPNYRSNAKAVSSLARQLDKKYAMIESFHSVGWTMTLQDAKWMLDKLGSEGINLYNFHAFYYTIQDITKHDAPPSQFLQNPYWQHYRQLADYAARMSVLISHTEGIIPIAVLDPVPSLWARLGNPFHGFSYAGEDEAEARRCEQIREDWVYLCKTLRFHQLDYDHLDGEILKEASIKDGCIHIGRARYQILILPPGDCIEAGVYEILKSFMDQGGCVISAGLLPEYMMGNSKETGEDYRHLFGITDTENAFYWQTGDGNRLWNKGNGYFFQTWGKISTSDIDERLIEICRRYAGLPVDIQVEADRRKDVVSCIRQDDKGELYLFVGNQSKKTVDIQLHFSGKENLCQEYLCLEDGASRPVNIDTGIQLEGFAGKWLHIYAGNQALQTTHSQEFLLPVAGDMAVSISGRNVCRFGQAEISLNQEWWRPVEVKTFIEQCQEVSLLGNENIHFTGMFGIPKEMRPAYPLTCYYKMEFYIDIKNAEIPTDISLFMDQQTIAGDYQLQINGNSINKDDFAPCRLNDQNNQECPVSAYLQEGENEILIAVEILKDEDGLRDPIYLLGSFGVEPGNNQQPVTIVKQPEQTNWPRGFSQGFPFYSGTMTFTRDFDLTEGAVNDEMAGCQGEDFQLRFLEPEKSYDCIEVEINGQSLGTRCFSPYIWSGKQGILKKKENRCRIKITNTLGNMLDGAFFDYTGHKIVPIEGEDS